MQSRMLTIREQWLALGVILAILFGGGVLLWQGSALVSTPADTFPVQPETPARAAPPAPQTPEEHPAPAIVAPQEPAPEIAIGAIGAVRKPGLYYFQPGARVQDLLDAAGGTLPESDLSDINRTAFLIDETTLLVPSLVTEGSVTYRDPPEPYNPPPYTRSAWYQHHAQSTAGPAAAPAGTRHTRDTTPNTTGPRININTASQQELEGLPGIGPVTARKIIAHRQQQPFTRPEDLENVSGIGPAKMAAVRDLISAQ